MVADTGNSRIQVFDKLGQFMFQFGSLGSKRGQFKEPYAITVDQFGFMYVADRGNNRIQIVSPNGIFLDFFEVDYDPVDIGIDLKRNLYVLAPEIGKIIKYDLLGNSLQDIRCVVNDQNALLSALSNHKPRRFKAVLSFFTLYKYTKYPVAALIVTRPSP